MEILVGLLLVLLLLGGSIAGLIAVSRLSELERELGRVKQQVALLSRSGAAGNMAAATAVSDPAPVTVGADPAPEVPSPAAPVVTTPPVVFARPAEKPPVVARPAVPRLSPATQNDEPDEPVESKLASRWMVWVGGVSLALGGIFLVKFGVEHTVLGPLGRVFCGCLLGGSLLILSERLRYLAGKDRILGPGYVPAALSGGGVIALYASLLTAFTYYHLLPAPLAFLLLALVCLTAMGLALLQGPLLAVLGLLGGYLVPALVSTGSGFLPGLLGYVALVSAASLLLQFHVQRRWLWWGTVLGHFLWFAIALWGLMERPQSWLPAYLLISLYGFIALPGLGWRLAAPYLRALTPWEKSRGGVKDSYFILLLGSLWLLLLHWQWQGSAASWLAIGLWVVGLNWLGRRILALQWAGWIALVLQLALLLGTGIGWGERGFSPDLWLWSQHLDAPAFWRFWSGCALVLLAQCLLLTYQIWQLPAQPARLKPVLRPGYLASLLVCAPLLSLALLYWRSPVVAGMWSDGSLIWPLQALLLMILFALGSEARRCAPMVRVAFLAGANGALVLALVTWLKEEGLTVALALQLLLLANLARRAPAPMPHWLFKLLMAIVVVRLSLNPWLAEYPKAGVFGLHWSLYGYGIPVICAFAAARRLPASIGHHTAQWLEAAGIQLLTLWLSLEGRYFLTHGEPFAAPYDFASATFHGVTWGALALVYGYKARLPGVMQGLYGFASRLLCAMMLGMIWVVTLFMNPLFNSVEVGSWLLLNWITLAWAIPALLCLLALRFIAWQVAGRAVLSGSALLFTLIWLSLSVRHLWHGSRLDLGHVLDVEQYTYSAVWLLFAIVLMVLGGYLAHARLRQAALAILALAVLKIFLWDMSGLDGLYRALSFIGLGGALVGLGWFYQHRILPLQAGRGRDSAS